MKQGFWDNVISGLDTEVTASALEKASRNSDDDGQITFIQLDSREYERLLDSRRFFKQLVACLTVCLIAVSVFAIVSAPALVTPGNNEINVSGNSDTDMGVIINGGNIIRYTDPYNIKIELELDLPTDSESMLHCIAYVRDGDTKIPIMYGTDESEEIRFVPGEEFYTTEFYIRNSEAEPFIKPDDNNPVYRNLTLVLEYNYLSGERSGKKERSFTVWNDTDAYMVQSGGNIKPVYNGGAGLFASAETDKLSFNMIADRLMSATSSANVSVKAKVNGVNAELILDKLTEEMGFSCAPAFSSDIIEEGKAENGGIIVNAGELMSARITVDIPEEMEITDNFYEIELTYFCSCEEGSGVSGFVPFIFSDTVKVPIK